MTLKKWYLSVVLLLGILSVSAQDFSKTWNQYYSYLNISAIDQSEGKVYVAAENAIFTYDKQTNVLETISSVNGLSGEAITSIKYVPEIFSLFVGYESGLIQIYNEINREVFNIVDIVEKQTIISSRKRINSFMINKGLLFISAGFGISEYDIVNLEFGDSFFIGNNGSQVAINETVVLDDYIYAASEIGIRRALINNPNLIDYQQWTTATGANWTELNIVDGKLYAAATNRRVYEVDFPNVNEKEFFSSAILDLTTTNTNIIVTTVSKTKVYDQDYNEIITFLASDYNSTQFSVGVISENNEVFIGTKGALAIGEPGYGMLKSSVVSSEAFIEIHPSGPILNRVFQLDINASQIWAIHGSFSNNYGFSGGIKRAGISRFVNDEWANIPYSSLTNGVTGNPFYSNNIVINKFNPNKAFVSTYWTAGFLEFQNDEVVQVYNDTNSSLEKAFGLYYLLMAANYDANDNLWLTNGRVNKALNRFKDGVWESVDLSSIITNATGNLGFSDIAFDQQGNVFLGSSNNGVISYNVTTGSLTGVKDDENNMPNNDVRSLVVDRNNQLWIGTIEGLRVAFNPIDFANGSPEVESIIFLEDGLGTELFFQQYINDIEVDGTNNKWIGTIDNGAYYLSPDGQETINHYTKDNSPLPSNDILDIEINETTGEVFFATDNGMVSFKGTSSAPQENLENSYIYPNPVRPGFNFEDKIKITGLTANVNIKIVDIEGNLVTEAESRSNGKFNGFNLEVDGGTALWNGRNLSNQVVASGVYVVLLNDLETFETKVLKVMIVR